MTSSNGILSRLTICRIPVWAIGETLLLVRTLVFEVSGYVAEKVLVSIEFADAKADESFRYSLGRQNSPSILMDKIHNITMHLSRCVVANFKGESFEQFRKNFRNPFHSRTIRLFIADFTDYVISQFGYVGSLFQSRKTRCVRVNCSDIIRFQVLWIMCAFRYVIR